MRQAFIIMRIGDKELDRMCEEAIVPAVEANGLQPRRVDKHNKGGLLKKEIIEFIENSDIIIADLTGERPNCYLEIGYTMGKGKFTNLILTAQKGTQVHFDLQGYEILFWQPSELGRFRNFLARLIGRRSKAIQVTSAVPSPADVRQEN